jgi:hypothetical protein
MPSWRIDLVPDPDPRIGGDGPVPVQLAHLTRDLRTGQARHDMEGRHMAPNRGGSRPCRTSTGTCPGPPAHHASDALRPPKSELRRPDIIRRQHQTATVRGHEDLPRQTSGGSCTGEAAAPSPPSGIDVSLCYCIRTGSCPTGVATLACSMPGAPCLGSLLKRVGAHTMCRLMKLQD